MARHPVPYSIIVETIDALPETLREVRRLRRLNLRDAAKEIGVPFNSLSRFECGNGDMMLSSAMAIMRWLDGPTAAQGAKGDQTA